MLYYLIKEHPIMTTKQKNSYETPVLDIVLFSATDILTSSSIIEGNPDDMPIT